MNAREFKAPNSKESKINLNFRKVVRMVFFYYNLVFLPRL